MIPWAAAHQASLSITKSWSLLKLVSIESVVPFNHPVFCIPLLFLPSIFPSIRVFSNESILHIRWPKYWSFSFSISPSNEYSGLISFRMDWLDGSPCSPRDSQESSPTPQFKSINSWVLNFLCSPVPHPYMTIGKTIALARHLKFREKQRENMMSLMMVVFGGYMEWEGAGGNFGGRQITCIWTGVVGIYVLINVDDYQVDECILRTFYVWCFGLKKMRRNADSHVQGK